MSVTLVGYDQQMEWGLSPSIPVVLDIPGGAAVGRLMVVYFGPFTIAPNSGWTGLGTQSPAGSGRYFGMWRVSDGTEGSTLTVTFPTTNTVTYDVRSPVLIVFGKRSFTETPSSSWSPLTVTLIPPDGTGYAQYDAGAAASAASDSIYLAWTSYKGQGANLGWDVCTQLSINFDTDITPVVNACNYGEHVIGPSNPALASYSTHWAVGYIPVVGGVNPATTSTITGTWKSGGSRYMHRSTEAGIEIPEGVGFWGINIAPV